MKVPGWLIMEPGADRPYFCHNPPTDYQRRPGAKVYHFVLEVPDEFVWMDGLISAEVDAATTTGSKAKA
jgi:hypothetical protein